MSIKLHATTPSVKEVELPMDIHWNPRGRERKRRTGKQIIIWQFSHMQTDMCRHSDSLTLFPRAIGDLKSSSTSHCVCMWFGYWHSCSPVLSHAKDDLAVTYPSIKNLNICHHVNHPAKDHAGTLPDAKYSKLNKNLSQFHRQKWTGWSIFLDLVEKIRAGQAAWNETPLEK